MLDAGKCSCCGAELSPNAGHCPACLLQLGLECAKSEAPILKPGDRIASYELRAQIGEGGCGVVFLAEQSGPIRRQVALKVVKPGMDTRQVIARFEAERQALALLEHPNIAKIFDAGASESGRPFFAMELVRGVKITDYCDHQKLSIRERLQLFIQVCQAVHHAHQKGIIHRDLKPSNILVSEGEDGAGGVPKIIDFGIAKSMEQPFTETTLLTASQQFIGTPAYMSPEQAGGGGVDRRTDVYALGILLYELLTGLTPFNPAELHSLTGDEALRFIRDVEPLRPSARLSLRGEARLTDAAQCRQIEPSQLANLLRGDLDWIVMKCLEKDRALRYETASGLALDLQRHLAHQPITARAPGQWHRLEKLVRRNRLVAGATTGIALTLLVGTIVSTEQAVRARHAEWEQARLRREAQAESLKNAEVAQFLRMILQGAQPSAAMGQDTTMLREILDRAAMRLRRDLTNQPEIRAELFSTLAQTYHDLGLYEKMDAMARESLACLPSGVKSMTAVRALAQIGDAEMHLGKLDEAAHFTNEALQMRRQLPVDGEPDLSGLSNNLGLVRREQGQLHESETLFRDALQMDEANSTRDNRKIATDLGNLGAALFSEGKLRDAEDQYRQSLSLRHKMFGEEHPEIAVSLGNLAAVLAREGNFSEAETLTRKALALDRKFLSADHPDLPLLLGNLGNVLAAQNKWPEAESADREAIAAFRKLPETNHAEAAVMQENLANDLSQEGKPAEAIEIKREAQSFRSSPAN
ncbi:MAG TPA: serine/threonine-protein kinase [Verrucomicrobiae bacterium]|nr:serine/threonine-protein kinase [Verrucomicrobiae bacterium]